MMICDMQHLTKQFGGEDVLNGRLPLYPIKRPDRFNRTQRERENNSPAFDGTT